MPTLQYAAYPPIILRFYIYPTSESTISDQLVHLSVFNEMGREVTTLVNGYQTANIYHVQFNGASLPSGLYFYRISTGAFTATQRMTLTK